MPDRRKLKEVGCGEEPSLREASPRLAESLPAPCGTNSAARPLRRFHTGMPRESGVSQARLARVWSFTVMFGARPEFLWHSQQEYDILQAW